MSKKLNEKMLLICIIGALEAVWGGELSIIESEQFLFSPHMIQQLKKKKYNKSIISLVEEACELEDIASLIPEKLDRNIVRMKQKALEMLKEYDAFEKKHWI